MRLLKFTTSCYAAEVAKCLDLKGIRYRSQEVPYFDCREVVALRGDIKAPVLVHEERCWVDSPAMTALLGRLAARGVRLLANESEVLRRQVRGSPLITSFRAAVPSAVTRVHIG